MVKMQQNMMIVKHAMMKMTQVIKRMIKMQQMVSKRDKRRKVKNMRKDRNTSDDSRLRTSSNGIDSDVQGDSPLKLELDPKRRKVDSGIIITAKYKSND